MSELTKVTILENVKKGDLSYKKKRISIVCDETKDIFAETHKEFTKDQKKQAKLNYKAKNN